MRIRSIVMLLFAHLTSAAAQSPVGYGVELAASRFGAFVIAAYTGQLEWTHTSGTSHYSASATLLEGVLHCSATSRDTDGTFSASGPGLIDITLGIQRDNNDSVTAVGTRMYVIRAACPHPRSPPPHEAKWSDEYSTYKQPGGAYDATHTATGRLVVRKLPDQLQGQWAAQTDEEQRTMSWRLCLRELACPGSRP